MNFTYTVTRAYTWGSLVNGTWNGMVGDIILGKYDVIVASLTMSKERSEVVKFLPPLKEVSLS